MNNAIAIVALVVVVLIICVFFKSIVSTVSGVAGKMPQGLRFIILIAALILAVVLLGYLFDHTKIFGTPGNPDGTVTDIGNASEEITPEQSENTIILSGDQIWINGEKTDLMGAEKYISEFANSSMELTIVDDYSTSYIHHSITQLCTKNNVIPRCVDENGNEQ